MTYSVSRGHPVVSEHHLPLLVFTTGRRTANDLNALTHETNVRSQLNLNQPFLLISATSTYFFSRTPQVPEERVKMLISPKLLAIGEQQRRMKLFLWKGEAAKEL